MLSEVHKKAFETVHGQVAALLCEDCFSTQSTSHWTCTLSKNLLADTIRSQKHATGPDKMKMLIKHNREMNAQDKGWVIESNFWLCRVDESGELRVKRTVLSCLKKPRQ